MSSPSGKSIIISLESILLIDSLLSKLIANEIAFRIVVFPDALIPINEIAGLI